MATIVKDLGIATAYGYAKSVDPNIGTEEEFAELMADYAHVAQDAEESALKAEGYATGTQDGEPSEEYAGKSAKHYSEAAGQSATDASGSADTAGQKAGEASGSALKAEGYAVGKQDGTDVQEGSPYWHASAKYHAEQAAGSATTARNKAGEASQSATNASGSADTAGQRAGEASRSAQSAGASALKAEGFATGQQNGQDVGSDSPYYEKNAEYFAGQAAGSATAAEQAAASITPATDEETAEMLDEVFGGENS